MSEFVMVPRDLLEKAAGMVESYSACVAAYVKADDLERWDYVPGIDDCAEDLRAALAATPPAASVRARELVWECLHSKYWRAKPFPGTSSAYYAAQTSDNTKIAAMAPDEHLGMFDDVDAAKAACEAHWQAYVRTLLVPVDEANDPEMCPNCVTPWKCNGPHEFPAATSEAPVAWMRAAGVNPQFEPAVISATVKSIWLRVKPARVERYTVPLYTHPASTNTDAGVTEAMVETFEAKFLECARTRPDSTLRDDIRAALVAALARAGGK